MLRRLLDDKFLASFNSGKPYDKGAFIELILPGNVDPSESHTLTDQNVIADHGTAVVVGINTVSGIANTSSRGLDRWSIRAESDPVTGQRLATRRAAATART
jgi:hypothetical protein